MSPIPGILYNTVGKISLAAATGIAALVVNASPALADDPTQVTISPDETAAVDEGGEYIPPDVLETPNAEYCEPHYVYGIYSNPSNNMRVFDRWFVTNNTGSSISATFKADTGGTVTVTAGITLSAEASAAVFAKVSASVNSSISKSLTASTGVSTTSNVKAPDTLYGGYGIWREVVKMKRNYMYSNCNYSSSEAAFAQLAEFFVQT